MITLTPAAAQQIQLAAQQSNAQHLALRLEIRRKPDGSFNYLMGFDEEAQVGDIEVNQSGVKVVIGVHSQALVQGMTLDFIELEGRMEFVFLNPNDPHFQPPQE